MCGICGFTGEDKKLINDMINIINHRGPNQQGFYTDSNVSLGHARLSIIDLSEKGKQPMTNEEGDILITFNGEIYNFAELRIDLESKGHKFRSNTDTEVIIHAYEEYGINCLQLFNGMFAFAIWDSKKKQIFLARDRTGIKPLYYSLKNKSLIFASEIKAILLSPNITKDINPTSLHSYLTFRYFPGEETIFQDVKKLAPGNYIIYNLKKSEITKGSFWDLKLHPIKKPTAFYARKLNNTLKEAVEKRMISDVPIGAFLSGGLDSSYVVSLMDSLIDQPIKTFSIGFNATGCFDERKYSRIVAEQFNTDHKEIVVEENSFNLLPKILWHMDEPIADVAAIPTYILSREAKKKVSVVLTGEGADEILGGYRKYKYLQAFNIYYKTTPLEVRKIFSKGLNSITDDAYYKRMTEFNSATSIPDYYLKLISYFTDKEKQELCNPKFFKDLTKRPDLDLVSPYFNKGPIINSLMTLDFKTWLPEDILMKVDRMTMSHALEARVPFLDPNMLTLISQIPPNLKLKLNKEKYILRKAMKGQVPDIIYKRKKQGFNMPINQWLENELKEVSQNLLSKESINQRGLFNHDYVEKLFKNYSNSKTFYSRQLWNLLNFEIWARVYLDENDLTKGKNIEMNNIL
ncbi:MAG: asparagine synthase (glutamine-hydrolyzing) [Nanoarchaeota archaeon]|nr:asparagine synthase (glutamine-hydrolyzing) [Nanoarchaeota archaeon]